MRPSSECDQAIARLIASTKRRVRPVSLVEVARDVGISIKCLGGIEAVAEKIHLSKSMLRRFLLVERLVPALRLLAKERKIDSIDAVAELASLSESNQELIGGAIREQRLDTADIRSLVRLLNQTNPLPFPQILAKVLASQTKRVFVYEFVARAAAQDLAAVTARFRNTIGENLVDSVEITGAVGRLKLNPAGKKTVSSLAKAARTTVTRFVQDVANGDSA